MLDVVLHTAILKNVILNESGTSKLKFTEEDTGFKKHIITYSTFLYSISIQSQLLYLNLKPFTLNYPYAFTIENSYYEYKHHIFRPN